MDGQSGSGSGEQELFRPEETDSRDLWLEEIRYQRRQERRRRQQPIAWSYRPDPRQRDLARLLSAIVADGPTERKLFGDDDVPGGIDDDDDPDWDKESF